MRLVSLLLGCALAAGCARPPAPVVPDAGDAQPKELLASLSPRDLCLADPGADGSEGRRLHAALDQARKRGSPDDWVRLGNEWVRKARLTSDSAFYVNVSACATTALELEADSLPALGLRGQALMNDHKFEEARALAARILELDPEDVAALGLLSDALLELGRYDEAADAAQRQMRARPGMAAHVRGSYLRWLRGDTRRAKLLIRDALVDRDASDPEPAAWTFVEAGTIYWQEADYAGADSIYAEALRWIPDYPGALVGRARVALARKDPASAIPWLEKAYAERPLAETAWLLGDARAMAGDAAGAERAYAEVVGHGRRGEGLILAAFYAAKNREIEEALRLIEAERRSRGGVYVEDVYAWALYRAGKIAEARQASDRALRLGTRDARLLYHAGAIRIAAGEAARGRDLVRQALALNPAFDCTGAAEARSLLERT